MSSKLIAEANARSNKYVSHSGELSGVWEPHELSDGALLFYLAVSLEVAEEALKKIATGEGYYGLQAAEYKQIAARALARLPCSDVKRIATDGSE